MPEYNRNLDVYQGYDFKKDKRTPVGFVTRLRFGTLTLPTDQICTDPMNPTQVIEVVSVLNSVMWAAGVTDAVYFSGQLSTANARNLALRLMIGNADLACVCRFSIYEYDPLTQRYFMAFHGNGTDLNGLLEKAGDDLNLRVADQPSHEVQSPENFSFWTGIKPQSSAQALHLATAAGQTVVKPWGLASL